MHCQHIFKIIFNNFKSCFLFNFPFVSERVDNEYISIAFYKSQQEFLLFSTSFLPSFFWLKIAYLRESFFDICKPFLVQCTSHICIWFFHLAHPSFLVHSVSTKIVSSPILFMRSHGITTSFLFPILKSFPFP